MDIEMMKLDELRELLAENGWTLNIENDGENYLVSLEKGEDTIAFGCPVFTGERTIVRGIAQGLRACHVVVEKKQPHLISEVENLQDNVNTVVEEIEAEEEEERRLAEEELRLLEERRANDENRLYEEELYSYENSENKYFFLEDYVAHLEEVLDRIQEYANNLSEESHLHEILADL